MDSLCPPSDQSVRNLSRPVTSNTRRTLGRGLRTVTLVWPLARPRTIQVTTRDCVLHGDLLRHCLTRFSLGTSETHDIALGGVEPLAAQALDVARALGGEAAHTLARGIEGARALALAERASRWIKRDARESRPASAAEKL